LHFGNVAPRSDCGGPNSQILRQVPSEFDPFFKGQQTPDFKRFAPLSDPDPSVCRLTHLDPHPSGICLEARFASPVDHLDQQSIGV
jgi:hypothetical protein